MKKGKQKKASVPVVKQEKTLAKRVVAIILCVLLTLGVVALPVLSVLS
jgi:hypothetical protein